MTNSGDTPFRSVRVRERTKLLTAQRTAVTIATLLVGALVLVLTTTWVVAARRIDGTSVVALEREPDGVQNTVVALAPEDQGAVDGIFVLQAGGERTDPAVLVLPTGLEVDVADEGIVRLGETTVRGGMAALVEEVADYTGLEIHHYLRVNRTALAEAIDRNGGIQDCPTEDAIACPNVLGADVAASLEPPQGAVSGPDRVLALLDAGRLVGGEVARPRTVLDPRRGLRWAGAWSQVLRTDVDPGPGGARDIGRLLAEFDPSRLQIRVLPGLIDDGRVSVTPESAAVLLDAFVQVGPLPADVGTEAPRELVPEDVVVQVLNGVGTAGVAGEMADFLVDRGFELAMEPDNAPRFDPRAPTSVGYQGEENLLLAELVASFLPGAEIRELIQPPPPGVDVVVTVGANGTG